MSSEPQADAPTVARQGAAVRERGAAERLTVSAAMPWRAAGERGATLVRPALARWRAGMAAGRVDRLSGHWPARLARHERHHHALAAGVYAMGLSLLPPESERLWTLNTIRVPAGLDEAAVR